ncbi:PIN domain-containing protein [Kovacikia minuta CCNUW1]|uniref:type II toxin-antitoxin system VapC family toxin n=1 Tax=Kovacikia minuta TaxID=2931930 RepID=UPI001CCD4C4B|nr:PIN domain-containing protein [Kovacikia minuta]UBF23687.1 PIN domain-containing protein [Kovacikia minuta CCNUW1]
MSHERLFLDTAFIQALLNPRDDYHNQAKQLFPRIRAASEVWITEAIFAEVGNALSAFNRNGAVQFIQQCYRTDNIKIVSVDTALLIQALALYESRPDKTWGLTDCISFVVMQQQSLTDAVTGDRHFVQAGFCALMLDTQ